MISEYRQRFSEYHSEYYRDQYLHCSNRKERSDWTYISSGYRDLFDQTMIEELRKQLEELSSGRDTERSSLKRLIAFAVEGNLSWQVSEITREIEEYESGRRIEWNGGSIGIAEVEDAIARESDFKRRRDLNSRRSDAIARSQDLRLERIGKLPAAAQLLGFDNLVEMKTTLRGIDLEKLVERAGALLAATEAVYVKSFSNLIERESNLSLDDASAADLGFVNRSEKFDHLFAFEKIPGFYRSQFAALGFDTGKQANIRMENLKDRAVLPKISVFPIQIPEEIRFLLDLRGGQAGHRRFWKEAARAQNFAWTSKNIYPEFRIGGDAAPSIAWGMLFESLFRDSQWLAETFGFVENRNFRNDQAVLRLLGLRKQSAMAAFQIGFYKSSEVENARGMFKDAMSDALKVSFDDESYLTELDENFSAADSLRAAVFEAQLRDYLKSAFGSRWWASRKAGDMLIDIWNTGQRYDIEELSALIGIGEPDYEWLAQDLMIELRA